MRTLAALLTGLLLAPLAWAGPLDDIAANYEHPERYRTVLARLTDRGVPIEKLRALFTSAKADRTDPAPLRNLVPAHQISGHKSSEQRANRRFLFETDQLSRHLREHSAVYDTMEKRYGVPREIVGAILLKESALGETPGMDHDAFVVINTLLDGLRMPEDPTPRMRERIPRLIRFARQQMVSLVAWAHRSGTDLRRTQIPCSYAGAIGIPQFIPSNLRYAVAHGEGPADLSEMPDAILSAGHILRRVFHWPDKELDFDQLAGMEEVVRKWRQFDDGRASFAFGENQDGQEIRRFDRAYSHLEPVSYMSDFVRSLMRYNFSSDYALGVLRIARLTHIRMRNTEAAARERRDSAIDG
jgi:membrane-bound lytic murein transglycosylase B